MSIKLARYRLKLTRKLRATTTYPRLARKKIFLLFSPFFLKYIFYLMDKLKYIRNHLKKAQGDGTKSFQPHNKDNRTSSVTVIWCHNF